MSSTNHYCLSAFSAERLLSLPVFSSTVRLVSSRHYWDMMPFPVFVIFFFFFIMIHHYMMSPAFSPCHAFSFFFCSAFLFVHFQHAFVWFSDFPFSFSRDILAKGIFFLAELAIIDHTNQNRSETESSFLPFSFTRGFSFPIHMLNRRSVVLPTPHVCRLFFCLFV